MGQHSTAAPGFSSTQKMLHWAVVVLLFLQYLFFDGMGRPFGQMLDTGTASYPPVVIIHMTIEISVLVLALWRLSLRHSHGVPAAPAGEPSWAKSLAKLTHVLIYVTLIALPLGGLGAWFTGSETLAGMHEAGTNILLALLFLHVGAVLVHQFVWKTGLLSRMI